VKAAYPAFEPTVVGIDVLDIEDTVDDAWAMLDVERPVDNPGSAGKGGINSQRCRNTESPPDRQGWSMKNRSQSSGYDKGL
jgi:hypothetical protein